VHIGDVTHEEDDIFGDGVNVAARLEAVAPEGGIALSDTAYNALDETLSPGFRDEGEQSLKNIKRPVRVWMRGAESASLATAARVAGFPRLTVHEAASLDDRPEVVDLIEGLTADISLYLASVQWLETGRGYNLTQTLRTRGDRIRLESRLTSPSGKAIWSGKHDGSLADSFDWQDEVSEAVASEVLAVILTVEYDTLRQISEEDLTAQQLVLLGKMSFRGQSENDFYNSIRYHDLAIQKDPTLAPAYASALLHTMGSRVLRYEMTRPFVAKVPEWIKAAKGLVTGSPGLELTIAIAEYLTEFNPSKLRPVIDSALVRAPFDVEVLLFCGWGYVWMGDPLPAIDHFNAFQKLGRLSPYREVALGGAANAHVQAGRYEEAIELAQQAIRRVPDYVSPHYTMASAYAHLGRMDEAAAAVREVQRIEPNANVSTNRAMSFYGGTPEGERYLEGLLLAGLPE
jgi:adenylate cyclase